MIPLGLSAADTKALNRTLAASHSIHITVNLLNMNGERIGELSPYLLSGQVDVDETNDTATRSATISLVDPGRKLSFDSDSPSEGAIYLDRMIRVFYSVKVPGQGWVDIPVFTGPVTKLDRTDDVVNIEAQGKEILAKGAAWKPITFRKGSRKVDVIETLMRERAGETKFSIPDLPQKTPKDLSIGRQSIPWNVVQQVAKSFNRQLFYDGRGVLRLRPHPASAVYTFRDGDGGTVLSSPQISYDTEELANIVWVKGGTPKGSKAAISVAVQAPRSHPLSPVRLGRNGVPRYLLEVIEQQSIRSTSEARKVAHGHLNRSLLETVSVSADVLPVPHLEPQDIVRLQTDEFTQPFRLRAFSIPLTVGDSMSVGYTKRVSVKPRRNRKR